MELGYRGTDLPVGILDMAEIRLGPLPREAVVEVIEAIAGTQHRADSTRSTARSLGLNR